MVNFSDRRVSPLLKILSGGIRPGYPKVISASPARQGLPRQHPALLLREGIHLAARQARGCSGSPAIKFAADQGLDYQNKPSERLFPLGSGYHKPDTGVKKQPFPGDDIGVENRNVSLLLHPAGT